jgi:hypothetical protein
MVQSTAAIANHPQAIVGLPLSIVRDASDMKVFHFGKVSPHKSGRGTVGQYALHVQCPWRIVTDNGVITGKSDRFIEPSDDGEIDLEDARGGTLQAVRICELLGGFDAETNSHVNQTRGLFVRSVENDVHGGLAISFEQSLSLEVFPDISAGEEWRFIECQGKRDVVLECGRLRIDGE